MTVAFLVAEGAGAGLTLVILRHDVAVVADDRARTVPGLVDAGALDGADVQVGLAVDAADRLQLAVARAAGVDDRLAGLLLVDADSEDGVAADCAVISVGPAVGAADRSRAELLAARQTGVDSDLVVEVAGVFLGLAGAAVSDLLASAAGEALVVVGGVVGRANRQENFGADALAVGRGRKALSVPLELGSGALQVAEVVISLAVVAANRRNISDAVDAFLVPAGLAFTVEGLLHVGAVQLAFADIVASINAANGLVDEQTEALVHALVQALELVVRAPHDAVVLIGDARDRADRLLGRAAGALDVVLRLVVEVVAGPDADPDGAEALGAAEVGEGHAAVRADRIVGVIAGTAALDRRAVAEEPAFLGLAERVHGFRREPRLVLLVAADAPPVIGLVDAGAFQEAPVLVGLAVDAANRLVLYRAALLGNEVVRLLQESRYVHQPAEAVVGHGSPGDVGSGIVAGLRAHYCEREQQCCTYAV